jgi:hypothetical protein
LQKRSRRLKTQLLLQQKLLLQNNLQ